MFRIFERLSLRQAVEQRARFLLAAALFSGLAAAGLVARTAGVSLFVAEWGPRSMPVLYLGTAALVLVVSLLTVKALARWSVGQLLEGGLLAVIAIAAVIRVGLLWSPRLFSALSFFLADLIAQVLVLFFWTLAARLFDPRESRRILAWVGAAGTTACIAAGWTVRRVAGILSSEDLLWLVMGLLLLSFAVMSRLNLKRHGAGDAGRIRVRGSRPARGSGLGATWQLLRREALARSVATIAALSAISLLLVDYVFVQRLAEGRSSEQIAAFLGTLYGTANVAGLVVQVVLVAPLLLWGGVTATLLALPAWLLVTGVASAATGSFGAAVAAKAAEPVVLFTLQALGLQMLQHGLARGARDRIRMMVEGVLRPAMLLVGGALLLIGAAHVDARVLSALVALLALYWIVTVRVAGRRYRRGLMEQISNRSFAVDHGALDAETAAAVQSRLVGAALAELRYLLALVGEFENLDWVDSANELLLREEPDARRQTLAAIAACRLPVDSERLQSCVRDVDPRVRLQALRALIALGRQVEIPLETAGDEDPAVCALAALATSQRHGSSARAVESLLVSSHSRDRLALAEALCDLEHPDGATYLAKLWNDDDPGVRAAALRAGGQRGFEVPVRVLRNLADDPATAALARDALVARGDAAVEAIVELQGSPPDEDLDSGARWLCRALGEIGGEKVTDLLEQRILSPRAFVAVEAARAWAAAARRGDQAANSRARVNRVVRVLVVRALEWRQLFGRLDGLERAEFLRLALREAIDSQNECIARLIALEALGADVDDLVLQLHEGAGPERAGAVEFLEETADPRLRKDLRRLFDEQPSKAPSSYRNTEAVRSLLVHQVPPGVVAGGLWVLAVGARRDDLETVKLHLDHTEGWVRETAWYARMCCGPSLQPQEVAMMQVDSYPGVRALLAASTVGR